MHVVYVVVASPELEHQVLIQAYAETLGLYLNLDDTADRRPVGQFVAVVLVEQGNGQVQHRWQRRPPLTWEVAWCLF